VKDDYAVNDNDPAPDAQSDVVKRAIAFWDIASDAEDRNRSRGLRSAKFAQGEEHQWDENILSTRKLDSRPCESYNQIPNFINQVANDARMNMAQTKFIGNDEGDEETAEAMEDMARNIQTQSDAEIAYDTAFYGQCTNGWGWWRYITEYENDKSFDQIIKVKPVYNPFTVYDDPFAIEPDRLDRKRLLQVADMKLADFNDTYDRMYDSSDLESIGDSSPRWASSDSIRVAEYWERTEERSTLYRHKKTGEVTEDKPKNLNLYESRSVLKPKVKWYLINGKEVLDEKDWPGIYIPYVQVVGQEVNINGERIISGLVERMIPAQKQMNYWTNAATEMVALAPKTPFIADPEAIGPYQQYWDQANVRNYAYLPYRSRTEGGEQIAPPQRAQNGADIGAMMAMVQQAQQNFYNLSGIYPASLGQASNEKSGKAILARQREGDVSTFHIHDNMARGQRAGGRILADLMPKVYDSPRKVSAKKEDGTTYVLPINQSYKDGDKRKKHDLTAGIYDVAVTTGPSYTTKRQEAAEAQMQLIQAVGTEVLAGALPQIIRNFDFPQADKMAEAVERALPPQLRDPESVKEEERQIPPQVMAQIQQAQQMIEQLGAQLQQAQQELASKEADIANKQADLQLKQQQLVAGAQSDQLKAENDRLKLAIDADKLQLEREKIEFEAMKLQLEGFKAQQQSITTEQQPGEGDMGQNVEVLRAQLQAAEQAAEQAELQRQMDMEMRRAEADAQAEQQFLMAQQEEMERMQREQAEANKQAQMDALLVSLGQLQQTIASLNEPKEVVRDASGKVIRMQPVSRVVN
jgi:hypothetical protein